MPTPVKRGENLNKHTTRAEQEARAEAEAGVIPDRGREGRLEKPKLMAGNAAAARYWKQTVERMEGLSILDDLDSDMLGTYCVMLSRSEQLNRVCARVAKELKKAEDADAILEGLSKLDGVTAKLQTLERNLLQYAEKLGLTPSGRVRLAQKRAAAMAESDPDGDLYGD